MRILCTAIRQLLFALRKFFGGQPKPRMTRIMRMKSWQRRFGMNAIDPANVVIFFKSRPRCDNGTTKRNFRRACLIRAYPRHPRFSLFSVAAVRRAVLFMAKLS
jgi:hypothetical protein